MPRKSLIAAACHQMMMYISVEGLGSMNNSNGMYRFLHEGFDLGFKEVCINLQACDGMDSTFMGTLLLIHEEAVQAGGGLFLINLSEYNNSKLEELGVAHFLKIGSVEVPAVEFDVLPAEGDQGGRMSLVLKAHEELVRKNTVNEDVFGSFIKALRSSFQ